jgi:pimeloyl-ACP methyl ester carboxylesterase
MSQATAKPENEFALLPETAAAVGVAPHDTPQVTRKWFTASMGGHVSAVVWRHGAPAGVIVPDDGIDARALDRVALLLDQPLVILDRPGTGRSSRPPASPARSGRILAEAVRSFAPRAEVVVGLGAGGSTAALAATSHAQSVSRVVLVGASATDEQTRLVGLLRDKTIDVIRIDELDLTEPADVAGALAPHLSRPSS